LFPTGCAYLTARAGCNRRLRGKVIERVEHEFEEGFLFLLVRFSDATWPLREMPRGESTVKFLRVEGGLQNQDHTISIKVARVLPISITAAETQSHDFH
jgi:hypothetical protein